MNQEYYERSERYLLDQMSESEKIEFEQEVKTNKALQKELEIAKAIIDSVALNAKRNVKAELNEIHNKHFGTGTSKQHRDTKNPRIWSLVRNIAAILILGILLTYVFLPKSMTSEELYTSYYEAPELELNYRGGDDDRVVAQLSQYYEAKNYMSYIKLADQQDSLILARPTLQFAKAIAYVETENLTSAIPLFEKLRTNPLHKKRSQWYLALTYLNEGNLDKAKSILNEIADGQGSYNNKAKEILGKL